MAKNQNFLRKHYDLIILYLVTIITILSVIFLRNCTNDSCGFNFYPLLIFVFVPIIILATIFSIIRQMAIKKLKKTKIRWVFLLLPIILAIISYAILFIIMSGGFW